MSTIKLICLFRGNLPEDAFEVEIRKNKSIDYLKEVIFNKIPKEFLGFIPRELSLWKVDISTKEKMKFEKLKTHSILTIKEILGGEKMKNIKNSINYYFSDDMILDEECIHIIAEPPVGSGECKCDLQFFIYIISYLLIMNFFFFC